MFTRSRLLLAHVFVTLLLLVPATAGAQVWIGSAKPRAGSVEVSGGGTWTGGQTLSSSSATLTPNPSSGLSSFDLFSAEPRLGPALGAHGTVGVYLTPTLLIEGGVQFSRPTLEVELSGDAEDAAGVTASTTITSYVFTGSLVYHFARSARTVPFVAGGAGHIRDVHAGNETVETGIEYHAKGGIKSWLDRARKFALRAEAGVSLRDGGFSYDDERRIAPAAAVSLLYLF